MSAAQLIRQLKEAGIHLSASGDRLRVEAPAGIVTAELRQCIAENKAGLLVELQRCVATDGREMDGCRARLLALADTLGLPHSLVRRIPGTELHLWAAVPADALPVYLHALDDMATRQAGKVPPGDTASIYCQHCGPVYVHPEVAAVLPVVNGWPRALGCPWCAIRKAGGDVPRPRVTCERCASFHPDTINPAAGVGMCQRGHGTHYPMQCHGCGDFRPRHDGALADRVTP